jgi:hypothetical protein
VNERKVTGNIVSAQTEKHAGMKKKARSHSQSGANRQPLSSAQLRGRFPKSSDTGVTACQTTHLSLDLDRKLGRVLHREHVPEVNLTSECARARACKRLKACGSE